MSRTSKPDRMALVVERREGAGPTIVFLSGYASDMSGTKAVALDQWAARQGRAFVRFDYRGCGKSPGDFAAMTLDDWLADTLAVIDDVKGSVILVGSSMGGWLMLLAAIARPDRIAALVGIAAAPDFTEWGFSSAEKQGLQQGEDLRRASPYGAPMLTTAKFWASGQRLCLPKGALPIDCPVRLLHGQQDPDVPWQHSVDLAERLRSANVQATLIKDGDHRLSRDPDIALMITTIEALLL